MHHATDRISHTFVIPVVDHWPEQEIAQWGFLRNSLEHAKINKHFLLISLVLIYLSLK